MQIKKPRKKIFSFSKAQKTNHSLFLKYGNQAVNDFSNNHLLWIKFFKHQTEIQVKNSFSLLNQKTPKRKRISEQNFNTKETLHGLKLQSIAMYHSSFIQTILSASESHRICLAARGLLPPVGTCTLP